MLSNKRYTRQHVLIIDLLALQEHPTLLKCGIYTGPSRWSWGRNRIFAKRIL